MGHFVHRCTVICQFPDACSQIYGGRGDSKRTEHAAHGGQADAATPLQSRYLRLLHTDALAQFLLCEVLLQPGSLDGFADFVGMDSLGKIVVFTNLPTVLIKINVVILILILINGIFWLSRKYFVTLNIIWR